LFHGFKKCTQQPFPREEDKGGSATLERFIFALWAARFTNPVQPSLVAGIGRRMGKNLGMEGSSETRQKPVPDGVAAETHHLLLAAIREKRLVRFTLDGKTRVAEPHDYGVRGEAVRLLAYQISGASHGPLPGWRWIDVTRMAGLESLEKRFAGGRPTSGKHHQWDVLFARVDHS
jgi:hypothetical protein